MEKEPLSPLQGRSYDSTRRSLHRLRKIPEQGESSERLAKPSRQWMHRRHSSEGSFIHITGTGTTSEDSLDCGKKCIKGSIESKEGSQEMEEFPPGIGQYGDFHTIDWQRDLSRDTYRQKYITRKMKESWWKLLKGYYDKLSGWLCVFLVGVAAGSVAGFIDIGEGWMKDLKEGICPEAFWLNKEQCCWSSNETFYEGDECDQWVSWYTFFRLRYFSTEEYVLSYTFYVLWSLLFAALACSMVKTFAPYACGSGVPEIKTILSGFIMRGYLGKWTLVIKSLGTMLAVSAGLSLGKEGPLVHIVCCLGNIISYWFPKYGKNEAKKREVLSAAAAAGVSTAFGAPIGGVLFSLEELSYYFPMKTLWRSFFCALVAAFVLRSIDPFGTDHVVKFYMNTTRAWVLIELLPFILLGIMGGIIGATFIRCNITWVRYRTSTFLGKFPVLEVLLVTLLTSLINFPNEFTRMNASDLIRTLFSQCGINDVSPLCDYKRNSSSLDERIIETGPGINQSLILLLLALVWKYTITIFTFGIKIPTGLFIPSLSMGAIMGRIVGVGMQQLALKYRYMWPFRAACTSNENCMAPGLYAMIGAAACLAGVTRMTVSLVVIMFELTGRVDYILPLMATVVASKWVADAIEREGIYDAHIQLNQYPFLDNKQSFRHSTKAIDLLRNAHPKRELHCLSQRGMTLRDIEDTLKKTTHNGFPITISKDISYLIGFVLRRDLCLAIDHLKKTNPVITENSLIDFNQRSPENWKDFHSVHLNRIVDMAPLTITGQTPMETVIEMFCKLGLRQLLVLEHGRLLGIITKKDVLNHIQEVEENENHE